MNRRLFLGATLVASSCSTAKPVVTTNAADQSNRHMFEYFQDDRGGWWWRLKAGNGRCIAGSGEAYASKGNCIAAIESIKRNASLADVQPGDERNGCPANSR